MKGILFFIGFLTFSRLFAQDIAIQEVLYTEPFGNDKFELVNTSENTIDISSWWMCARFNYRMLGSPTDFEILEGSLEMQPGSRIKLRIISYDLDDNESDFGIFIDANFAAESSLHDFIQYGSSDDVGRGYLAVSKGIWSEITPGGPIDLDFIPTATAGNSTNWEGTNGGGGELTLSSDFTNGPPTLPISLLTLSGRINIHRQVALNWIALDEYNSNKHLIERSTPGQAFEVIGEVPSQNLGATPGYYHFLDTSPAINDLIQYRIRQLDYDGETFYSSPIYIRVKDVGQHKISISPMPISGIGCFSMEFYWPREEPKVQFNIVDMSGKIVESFNEPLLEGYNNVMHQFYGIQPGQYMMVLTGKSGDYVAAYFLIGM